MSTETPLTFGELYKGTHRFLLDNLKAFAVIGLLPFVIIAVLDYLSVRNMVDLAEDILGPDPMATLTAPGGSDVLQAFSDALTMDGVLLGLLSLLPSIVFAVAWQRFVLLGAAAPPTLLPPLGKPHLLYLLYTLVIVLALVAVLMPFAVIGGLISAKATPLLVLVGLVPGIFVLTRLLLVLPAVAVKTQGFGLEQAWKTSKGHVLPIFFAILLSMLPPLLVAGVLAYSQQEDVGYLIMQGVGFWSVVLANVVVSFCALVGTALQTAIAAHAFRRLAAWQP